MEDDVKVGVVVGSKSDLPIIEHCMSVLSDFGIASELKILSAHRTPREVVTWVEELTSKGVVAFIAGAGMAAHLAGVIAAHTTCPVLGVPMPGGVGLDSLLSMVQMPKGVPVATFAVGKAGAINAAIFSAQIIATRDKGMKEKLSNFRDKQRREVLSA